MNTNDSLLAEIKDMVSKLFSDTGVSMCETREALKDLRDYIDVMIDALDNDIRNYNQEREF